MTPPAHDAAPHSAAPTVTAHYLIEAEAALREAGRFLELIGTADTEAERLAGIVFRLASRVRSDRIEAHG
jgi:hypothetical protein